MSIYKQHIAKAVSSFWDTKAIQGNVLAGKQLDEFLNLLTQVAIDAGVPQECIYTKSNHIPGFFRATKDWDLLIIAPNNNLVAAIELKSQVGSYGNNLNNRTEESLGSAEDFWVAFREHSFQYRITPWLGYMMVVGEEQQSNHIVKINQPHYPVRSEFNNTTYLDRYRILCEKLIAERKYSSVALITTHNRNTFESPSDIASVDSFINALQGHIRACKDDFLQ